MRCLKPSPETGSQARDSTFFTTSRCGRTIRYSVLPLPCCRPTLRAKRRKCGATVCCARSRTSPTSYKAARPTSSRHNRERRSRVGPKSACAIRGFVVISRQVGDGVRIVGEHVEVFRCGAEQTIFCAHDVAQRQHAQADAEGVVLILAWNVKMRAASLKFVHARMHELEA